MRDTLLSIAETGLFRVLWSEEILDETRRNILDDNPHLRDTGQLDKTFAAMRHAFLTLSSPATRRSSGR